MKKDSAAVREREINFPLEAESIMNKGEAYSIHCKPIISNDTDYTSMHLGRVGCSAEALDIVPLNIFHIMKEHP